MNAERNLLFGVLAMQAGLVTSDDFIKACAVWATRKGGALGDVLVEMGVLGADDRDVLDRLLATRALSGGNALRAGLADVPEKVRQSLAALGNAEIIRSLAGVADQADLSSAPTLDGTPTSERYTLTRLHATGGIGRVWRARDNHLGREVALKEILPERGGDARLRSRFLQEAKVTGQLEHPGVVPVYELSHPPGSDNPFYTMRFVAGRTLREEVAAFHERRVAGTTDALALLQLMNVFVFVCNTIAYAHSRHVLHRDLKPQNIVVGGFGEVFVLDWGLAKVLEAEEGQGRDSCTGAVTNGDGSFRTVHGQAIGTPAYMAPEQAAGHVDMIDYRTDVYGLGAILYEILTGRPPFVDTDVAGLLRRVQEEDPMPPRQVWSEAPIPLEVICMRALSKRREQRYSSAIELAHEVQYWQEAQRRQAEKERDRFFSLAFSMLCIAGVDGYFKLLNPAWQKTLGWTPEELMARPWREFVHPDDLVVTDEEHSDVAQGGASVNFENRYRCKDGSYKWLLWNSMPVVDQGYIYATAVDISERKEAEEALRDSEERYRSVVSAMEDGIVLVDADGEIRACNASAERILGLSSEQMIGRAARDPRWRSIHEDGSPFPSDAYPVMVTLRTGEPCFDVVMGVHKPSGELTWVSINSQPLTRPSDKSPYAVLAVLRDINGRRRLEQELAETAAELAACRTDLLRLKMASGR